jgi:hypothetical protein
VETLILTYAAELFLTIYIELGSKKKKEGGVRTSAVQEIRLQNYSGGGGN